MTDSEIRKHFSVEHNSTEPLYVQLEKRFNDFISGQPPHTRLPSERDLAMQLDISRQSVKSAFRELARRKLIVRHRRLGTFTNPSGDAAGRQKSKKVAGDGDNALRLLLFENNPVQRGFWEETTEKFNHGGFGVTLRIEWLTEEIARPELLDRECDLLQLCHGGTAWQEQLQPLPDELLRNLRDPATSFTECFSGAQDALRCKLFPVYFCYWVWVINQELARHCASQMPDFSGFIDPEICYPQLARQLPEGCYVTGSAFGNIQMQGVAPTGTPDDLLENFRRSYQLGAEPAIINPSPGVQHQGFHAGRELLLPVWDSNLRWNKIEPDFPTALKLLWPRPGNIAFSGASFLGITAQCRRPKAAAMFLRFLLCDELQNDIATHMFALPAKRSALNSFRARFPEYSLADCERFINLHQIRQYQRRTIRRPEHIWGVFQQLANRMLTPEEAIEFIREQEEFFYDDIR